jgi:hypothetical protein
MGDADPDLVEGGRGFCKKCLEIHVECPSTAVSSPTSRERGPAFPRDCWGETVNGELIFA